jgi:hypothetical protein
MHILNNIGQAQMGGGQRGDPSKFGVPSLEPPLEIVLHKISFQTSRQITRDERATPVSASILAYVSIVIT